MPITPNKKSRRYKLMQLKVGESMVFPLLISSSIRAQIAEIKRTAGISYATELTPKQIRVTCTERPNN